MQCNPHGHLSTAPPCLADHRRENLHLRQMNADVGSTLVRAQRRAQVRPCSSSRPQRKLTSSLDNVAQDQLRLVRRAIRDLHDIQRAPRKDVSQVHTRATHPISYCRWRLLIAEAHLEAVAGKVPPVVGG